MTRIVYLLQLRHMTVREKSPPGQELCAVCREADLQVMAQKSNAEACDARASKTEISGFYFNW